ncbi:MAG TPA: hypothetical protein VK745_09015, partial [Polyangiaceae bacterium]|nr:hypothetical protein [Polyangiaceae bacterium]
MTPASDVPAPSPTVALENPELMVAQPAQPATGADTARAAGRGGLAVAFAKIYFIVVGLVQQIALPRLLGLDGYGALASVLSIAGITYNPVTTT